MLRQQIMIILVESEYKVKRLEVEYVGDNRQLMHFTLISGVFFYITVVMFLKCVGSLRLVRLKLFSARRH